MRNEQKEITGHSVSRHSHSPRHRRRQLAGHQSSGRAGPAGTSTKIDGNYTSKVRANTSKQ